MKRTRRRNYATWTSKWGNKVDYDMHPGAVLAKYMQWTKPTDGFANMNGPEPDTINVGVLAPYMITLGLEHEYYYRVDSGPMWISFGWSADPVATVTAVKKPFIASWTCDRARAPREFRHVLMPDNIMAHHIPDDENWLHRDIGDY